MNWRSYLLQKSKKIPLSATVSFLALAFFACTIYQHQQLQHAKNTLNQLQNIAQHIKRLQTHLPAPASATLPIEKVIMETAAQHQIAVQIATQTQNQISLTLPPLPFTKLIRWLADLEREHGIRITYLKTHALNAAHQVAIEKLSLKRSQAFI